jgi:hypothetical protein
MTHFKTTLRQLRLSGLAQALDVRLQEAAANRLGHEEFLELIFRDELNVRHQRHLERRTKAADFRTYQQAWGSRSMPHSRSPNSWPGAPSGLVVSGKPQAYRSAQFLRGAPASAAAHLPQFHCLAQSVA